MRGAPGVRTRDCRFGVTAEGASVTVLQDIQAHLYRTRVPVIAREILAGYERTNPTHYNLDEDWAMAHWMNRLIDDVLALVRGPA